MRDKEITGLYQAYLDVYSNSNEEVSEVEELNEDVQGAVAGALKKGAEFMKTNPVGKAVGSIIAPVNSGRKTPTATSGGYRKEEVEELDEVSSEVMARVKHKRMQNLDAAQKKEMGARDAGATMGEISKRAEETSDAAAKFSKHNHYYYIHHEQY